ncbi:hypothetical protein IMZ48_08585, partial [Candidatus Bathyarchaeota archaeon]|nr:hypothetical protein [Candidatus Bathyarchaeota archaeon]
EWYHQEAFEEAKQSFPHVIGPVLPPWLPTVVLGSEPGLWNDIVCPTYLPNNADQDPLSVAKYMYDARFLQKATELAFSMIKSQRGQQVLQELSKSMVEKWDAAGDEHAFTYGMQNNRDWRAGAGVVALFLDKLERSPPNMKLGGPESTNGFLCHEEIISHDERDRPVRLEEFNPREEVEIAIRYLVCIPPNPSFMNPEF